MLPFRFKAGGTVESASMSIHAQPAHHHRSTTKHEHKSFKSKHATKSALKDAAKGKVEREDRGKRRTPQQQVMSKLVRRNQAKQLRVNHKMKKDQDLDIFKGLNGAPKHLVIVPLSAEVDVRRAIDEINAGVDIDTKPYPSGTVRVRVDRYNRNVLFFPTTFDMIEALDQCKLADQLIFVLSAEQEIDESAHILLKSIEGQGVTNATFAVQDTRAKIPDGKLAKRLNELKDSTEYYFPEIDKLIVLDSKNDCSLLMRKICTSTTKGIRWRDARTWMHVESVRWLPPNTDPESANVTVTGVVRGRNLNPDRLIHVPGWGEFKIERVTQTPSRQAKRKADEMNTSETYQEVLPTASQDDLAELAPEQVDMHDEVSSTIRSDQKGVLLDDHHYFSDDESHLPERPKMLPAGTSDYQSAWYSDDMSDSDDEMIDGDMDMEKVEAESISARPEDGSFDDKNDAMTDVPGTEYPESEMHIDADEEEEARQLADFRASRKKEAEEDLEFPDEIELHPNILARERLAKYRGLKSIRTSEWNTAEDKPYEPTFYHRVLQIPDYKKSYNAAIKESLAGGIPAGSHVEIELQNVPTSLQQTYPVPVSLFSLLRHEHKQAIVNLNMTLSSTLEEPIKSKEELIVQIGHRRLAINPIFSAAGVTPNDVHKFDRFLHPGRTAVATFAGPLTWGSVPVLVFKKQQQQQQNQNAEVEAGSGGEQLQLIGTATTLPPSSTRIITKRVILTGHPFKIHRKLVTVRYMFFNREDVEWFKALPLWTKRGRQGFIKEPLGTHGYFKATFDGAGKVNGMDAIGVSIYKRVWPRESRRLN